MHKLSTCLYMYGFIGIILFMKVAHPVLESMWEPEEALQWLLILKMV